MLLVVLLLVAAPVAGVAALAGILAGARYGVPSCWRRCASICTASWTRWRRPTCCSGAPAIWSRWRPRTSRRSSTSSPTRSRRPSSPCWCPAAVLIALAVVAWPLALALLPFLAYAAASPGAGAAAHRRPGLQRARRAGRTGRACHRDDPGPDRTAGVRRRQGAGATRSWRRVRRYQAMRLVMLHDLTRQSGRARGGDRSRRPRGRRRGRAAGAARLDRADAAAAAGAGLDRGVPAGVRDRPGRPPACRYDRFHAPAARRAFRAGGDHRRSARSSRHRAAARPCGSTHVRFTYPGRTRACAGGRRFRRAGRGDGGAGRAIGRRQDHHRQSAAALLGSGAGPHRTGRRRRCAT